MPTESFLTRVQLIVPSAVLCEDGRVWIPRSCEPKIRHLDYILVSEMLKSGVKLMPAQDVY
jgi:hypothetical protein